MTRKSKIIVSVVGIFIVLLTLSLLTYAYYVTRIIGNPVENTFDVETSKVEVTYNDNSEVIVAEDILPSFDYAIEKEFTVTNTGEEIGEYAVIIDRVTNEFENTKDLVYILECSSNKGNSCNQVLEDKTFPSIKSYVVSNTLQVDEVHSYVLKVKFKESGKDQSADMNKRLIARVTIDDAKAFNPFVDYEDEEKTYQNLLAYKIINNSMTNTNETATKFKREESLKTVKSDMNERRLMVTEDDYGDTYYYRGNVEDNYLSFANKCWRIVRIEGDGSIKLILDNSEVVCDDPNYTSANNTLAKDTVRYGYRLEVIDGVNYRHADYWDKFNFSGQQTMKVVFDNWFNDPTNLFVDATKNLTSIGNLVKQDKWCVSEPNISTLKCSQTHNYEHNYIATLTSDEIIYAGAIANSTLPQFYLPLNPYITLLNPSGESLIGMGDYIYVVNNNVLNPKVRSATNQTTTSVIPAITLNNGVRATGTGLITDPYEIVVN